MKRDSEVRSEAPSGSETRFDEEVAQRILRRAAEADVHRESETGDSYTLEQLQAIASEAGISPEAVHAAAMEYQESSGRSRTELQLAEHERGWLAALRRAMPASWSPRLKNAVLAGAGIALFGLVTSLIGLWPLVVTFSLVVVLILILLVVLLLLGVGPV
jgi:hypothetical protein